MCGGRERRSVGSGSRAPDQEVMQVAGAREINDRYTAAAKARDLDAIAGLFAPDARIEDPTGAYEGRASILEYWETFFRAFPDLDPADVTTAEAGELVFNEWMVAGTHTGPLETPEGTIEPTGKRVELRGADVIEVRDGLIRSHRVYFDQMALLGQLGLVPEGAVG